MAYIVDENSCTRSLCPLYALCTAGLELAARDSDAALKVKLPNVNCRRILIQCTSIPRNGLLGYFYTVLQNKQGAVIQGSWDTDLDHFHNILVHAGKVTNAMQDDAFSDVLNEMIDELVLGLCFDFHRSVKIGFHELTEEEEIVPEEYKIIDQLGLDIFGHGPGKRPVECLCPNCSRNMAASRFAPHLEKCMGMGRNSSRVASRRLANTGKLIDEDDEDFFLDDDWTLNGDKRPGGNKKKRDKNPNSPRRSKMFKKNGEPTRPGTPSSDSLPAYKAGLTLQAFEGLSLEEKRTLLSKTCGVISEHTSKMCTKTQRCPQHTDDQRRSIRLLLLGQADTLSLRFRSDGFPLEQDEIQVDVDGFDDGDGQSLRDSLNRLAWEEDSNVSLGDEEASMSPLNSSNIGINKGKKKSKHRKKRSR